MEKEKERGHAHLWQGGQMTGPIIVSNKCACGAIICSSPSPDGQYDCNLEIGHVGPCQNTFHPEVGVWREKPKEAPLVIEIRRRSGDYQACLEGQTEIWESGKTPAEAIGKLIDTNWSIFNVRVNRY